VDHQILQNRVVSGLCPSSRIVRTREHSVSETGSVSGLGRVKGGTHSVRTILSHCTSVISQQAELKRHNRKICSKKLRPVYVGFLVDFVGQRHLFPVD
jgi:hypothetical protein